MTCEVLWQDGRYRCELRVRDSRSMLRVCDANQPIVELAVSSHRDARDRAAALRLLIADTLDGIRWIEV